MLDPSEGGPKGLEGLKIIRLEAERPRMSREWLANGSFMAMNREISSPEELLTAEKISAPFGANGPLRG